jgi:signal transduction histidine kinase
MMVQAQQSAPQVLPRLSSLNRVVFNLIELYQPALTTKRLGSGLDLDPALPMTWIDVPQLERGLASLLRNSIKYTREGDLIVCQTTLEGDWVQLTMGDSGPPINAERTAALMGSVKASSEDTAQNGSESELALSRAIIAAHGGEIHVDTSHETGAWFVVRLPAMASANSRLLEELERGQREQYERVAKLSYELRTPLNVIMGYNGLLLDGSFGSLTSSQADALGRMDGSSRELLALVNDTLDFGRLRAPWLPSALKRLQPPGKESSKTGAPERGLITRGIAEFVALALENAHLVTELERRREQESEFVVTTSHRLRTPLNVIIGYNDLLLDGEFGLLSTDQMGVLQRVRTSSLELLEAINANLGMRPGFDANHATA